jgi:hypothetical protein
LKQISLPSISSIEIFGHPHRHFRQHLSINGRRIGLAKNGGFFEFNAKKEYLRIEAKGLVDLNAAKILKIHWRWINFDEYKLQNSFIIIIFQLILQGSFNCCGRFNLGKGIFKLP